MGVEGKLQELQRIYAMSHTPPTAGRSRALRLPLAPSHHGRTRDVHLWCMCYGQCKAAFMNATDSHMTYRGQQIPTTQLNNLKTLCQIGLPFFLQLRSALAWVFLA